MTRNRAPMAFWIICGFLGLSVVILTLGQTTAVFAYDFAVGLGLQESVEEVTPFGVEVNRAFGLGDTVAYIPFMLVALVGLLRRKRWALPATAAVMGISVYWTVTIGAMLVFLRTAPGYTLEPGVEYWIFLGAFLAFGLWGLGYLTFRGDRLVS